MSTAIEVVQGTKHGREKCPFACCVPEEAEAEREKLAKRPKLVLRDLIQCYIDHFRKILKGSLGVYSGQSLSKVLEAAGNCSCPICGRRHKHQWRFPHEAAKVFTKTLKHEFSNGIPKGTTFEAMFKRIDRIGDGIFGVGPLVKYDTTLRLAVHFGISASDNVYLHAHAVIPGVKLKGLIPAEDFVPDFAIMGILSYEIEDFLCIFNEIIKSRNIKVLRNYPCK